MFDKEMELSYEFDIIKPCIYWNKITGLKILNHVGLKAEN